MRHKDGKSDPRIAAEDAELSGRLRDLDKRLGESRSARGLGVEEKPEPPRAAVALAMRMAGDFVAGIVVGAAIGWAVDQLFGTWPWGLAVFLLLGFAAGILNVLRTAGVAAPAPGRGTPAP